MELGVVQKRVPSPLPAGVGGSTRPCAWPDKKENIHGRALSASTGKCVLKPSPRSCSSIGFRCHCYDSNLHVVVAPVAA